MPYVYGDTPFKSKQEARAAGRKEDDGMLCLFVGIEIVGTVMVRSVLAEGEFEIPERMSGIRREVLERWYRPVFWKQDGPTIQETIAAQRAANL